MLTSICPDSNHLSHSRNLFVWQGRIYRGIHLEKVDYIFLVGNRLCILQQLCRIDNVFYKEALHKKQMNAEESNGIFLVDSSANNTKSKHIRGCNE